jgi:hypothetical protein
MKESLASNNMVEGAYEEPPSGKGASALIISALKYSESTGTSIIK